MLWSPPPQVQVEEEQERLQDCRMLLLAPAVEHAHACLQAVVKEQDEEDTQTHGSDAWAQLLLTAQDA